MIFCRFLILDFAGFSTGLSLKNVGFVPTAQFRQPLEVISRNEVLKKLRIALALRDGDMMAVFKQADFVVTKAELGSFFRKEGHRNFSKCPEQVLRKFIHGPWSGGELGSW